MTRTSSSQKVDLVRRQFEDQIVHYTNERRSTSNAVTIDFLAQWLGTIGPPAIPAICEFGGADGVLLKQVADRVPRPLTLVNAELVAAFQPHQAHPDIRFVDTSILDPEFADGTFDAVVARNVLHHLIGESLAETRSNQEEAIRQLFRVTRPGGVVLIEEMVNASNAACRIFYALSTLNSRYLRLRFDPFEITPNTVVAFTTPDRLIGTINRLGHRLIARAFQPSTLGWHWKLTMLRRKAGVLFLASERNDQGSATGI
jgi:SAM-dependent methyltransferase